MESALIFNLVCIFAVAAIAGISRCLRNGDFQSIGHLLAVASFSGCLGFGIVCLLLNRDDPVANFRTWHLGVSTFAGLAGKEQTALIDLFLKKFLNNEKAA